MNSRTGERHQLCLRRRMACIHGRYQIPCISGYTTWRTSCTAETRIYHVQIRFNHSVRRALALHMAFLNFQVWTVSVTASGQTYLNRFKHLVLMYLDQLGVISLNNVIRAVSFATDRSYVSHVHENHSIKFKFY
ncbi:Ren [Cleome golden mosaic virus]|uniref:Replication enhancer n=1 Tax=Cleome golden mosaic virus TaxID=858517 RepID=F5A3K9_9GEMI|nr:Ren [Cleome golden mosaic virus]AEB00554.1 Ren [Cleome golden mosaic virus]